MFGKFTTNQRGFLRRMVSHFKPSQNMSSRKWKENKWKMKMEENKEKVEM